MNAEGDTVFAVEDDPSMSDAILRLLRAAGVSGQMFPSAESLLASARAPEAACFVFDIQLPGMSGVQLNTRLTSEGLRTPVIFITAFDHPAVRAEAELANPVAYFTKPFSGREFVAAIHAAIAGKLSTAPLI